MNKKWMIKYVLAIVLGIVLAVMLNSLPIWGVNVAPPWYIWLLPLLCLSLLAVWKVIRRYVTLALARVDVGDSAYNVLFRCILVLGGVILLPPLLAVGFIMAVLHAVKEYTLARDDYEAGLRAEILDDEEASSHDDSRAEIPEITGKCGGSDEISSIAAEGEQLENAHPGELEVAGENIAQEEP